MQHPGKIIAVKLTTVAAAGLLGLSGCGFMAEDEPVPAPTVEAEVEPSDAGGEPTEAVAAPQMDGEADPKEKPANEVTGPGVYQAPVMGGATATVAVPGQPVEDIEAYRQAAGVDPVGYLVVEVDNTKGSEEAMIFEAKVVDSEGKTYTYEDTSTAIWEWAGDNYDLLDKELELSEKYPYSVLPSAKATVPLIGPEVPDDIVSVFVEYEQAERVGDL